MLYTVSGRIVFEQTCSCCQNTERSSERINKKIEAESPEEARKETETGFEDDYDSFRWVDPPVIKVVTEESFMHELNAPTLFDGIEQLGGQG